MRFKAFDKQIPFLKSKARIVGAFAGKRGGKTEAGAIRSILFQEQKPTWTPNGIDPYLGVIVAPTYRMLKNLSMAKFLAYAKPFIPEGGYLKTDQEVTWHDGSRVLGISADKPERMEGLKANWVWFDEVFQMSRQIFLESMARVGDQGGFVWATGSLGVQYNNPRQHWVHELFKEKPLDGSEAYEWGTEDNPYFPKDELDRLKDTLDPKTYRQMFQIEWDVIGTSAVYHEFTEGNVCRGYIWNKHLETACVIDWGWTHPMAALFFQYDHRTGMVYLFDEIVGSRIKREELWDRIKSKPYRVDKWYCDVSGTQERESAIANVNWFKQPPRNISFEYRSSKIRYGLPIVRRFILNGKGQRKLLIDELRCPKSLDGIRNYRYPEKDGVIVDENPVKKDDDCVDAIRYYFLNRHDDNVAKDTFKEFNRWGDKWAF